MSPSAPVLTDHCSDRCLPSEAAKLVGLRYPTTFTRHVHEAELVLNPDTLETSPVPEEYRIRALSPRERQNLSAAELAAYVERKVAAREWERSVWLCLPRWGGLKPPFGERTYSRAACIRWYSAVSGEPTRVLTLVSADEDLRDARESAEVIGTLATPEPAAVSAPSPKRATTVGEVEVR